MTKKKIILPVIIILIAVIGLYIFLMGNDKKAVRETTDRYIKAVMDRNFTVIYDLNVVSQKRRLFVLKDSSAKKDELIKLVYDEQKASFDSARPTGQSFDLNAVWSEKFIFTHDMSYSLMDVVMERDVDNPTASYRKRINAIVKIEIEYGEKDTSPMYAGQNIKKAVYLVKMIHSKNIARTVRDIAVDDKWLFKGIAVKEGSAAYW